jgi:hypothetical protein
VESCCARVKLAASGNRVILRCTSAQTIRIAACRGGGEEEGGRRGGKRGGGRRGRRRREGGKEGERTDNIRARKTQTGCGWGTEQEKTAEHAVANAELGTIFRA